MHTESHTHTPTQTEIKKMKATDCIVRREAKGRQSEKLTERYKLRGKSLGIWGLGGVKGGGEQNDIL